MKVLMIGMDGAHLEAFSRGWTPYISSLIEKGDNLELKEDLIMRGWLEIATGKNGVETGALYDKPKANGSYEWDLKFSINDIPGYGTNVKPIWQALNEKGYRVGVMNLPTVFPAPEVNGFMISGGGGGAPVVQTPTLELCYPKEEHPLLVKEGYVVDQRIVPMLVEKNITDPKEIFSILIKKNERRTHSFIRLANKYKIDFGFVIYKSSSNLAEWVLLPEWKRLKEGAKDIDNDFINIIKDYYQKFDDEIRKLHKAFPNAQIIFSADHSLAPREWDINPNIFLQKHNYQKTHSGKTLVKYTTQMIKKVIPFSLRAKLRKKKVVHNALYSSAPFDTNSTIAFCKTSGDWLQGIYINDEKRFGGPIQESEIEKIKKEIIDTINDDELSKEHGLKAYSKEFSESSSYKYFPDIVIDVPDGYLITDKTRNFIKKFIPPKGPLNLLSITKGELLCIKAHKPIAVIYNGTWNIKRDKGKLNLTAIYDHIITTFSNTTNENKS